jgi:hypothetical protein
VRKRVALKVGLKAELRVGPKVALKVSIVPWLA